MGFSLDFAPDLLVVHANGDSLRKKQMVPSGDGILKFTTANRIIFRLNCLQSLATYRTGEAPTEWAAACRLTFVSPS